MAQSNRERVGSALELLGRGLRPYFEREVQAADVDRQKQEVLRLRFEEQARKETKRAAVASTTGQPQAGLRPWREVVTPHPDVSSGRFRQAEFAADLAQVLRGEGSDEYR